MQDKIITLKSFINESKNIVIFSGAGMSVASGIPDFRSADGLYSTKFRQKLNPETILSKTFFNNYPDIFYDFYFSKMIYENAKPNIAHKYFSSLQNDKNITVITQNIDGLDKVANIKNVIELHGNVLENYCTKCHKYYSLADLNKDKTPYCDCGGIIKPNVVLYEENLDINNINHAIKKIKDCDLLIVIGTSLIVYPAASFINYYQGNKLVIINKEKTNSDKYANLVINDDIIKVINKLQNL